MARPSSEQPTTRAAVIAGVLGGGGAHDREGASTPVHRSNASAAWCTSIPMPLTAWMPRARAAARKGVSIGWYTVSTTN